MAECFKLGESRNVGRRRFHDIPVNEQLTSEGGKEIEDCKKLLHFIAQDVIGKDSTLAGPYGQRQIVYCDYIASGRALASIEDYVVQHILPTYGNTHTTTTVTSLQSSMYLQEARMMIRNAVRANEHDAVIFTGNGVTGAVDKLINALDLSEPPVVFVGPHEHHSNLLPWREIAAKVVRISETHSGHVNLKHLEIALESWKTIGLPMIGCFSAASNVTGVVTDTNSVSTLVHHHGGIVFWDYATAGPYTDIDMHPLSNGMADKDAILLSMHKFIGAVDSPGVLVAKRSLFKSRIPSNCGGGSVHFVTRDTHRYLQDEEAREEGGTPRVVGSVRAALAMELKQNIGVKAIMGREAVLYRTTIDRWKDCTNLRILGVENMSGKDQLAVFSFLVFCQQAKTYLHHNFVAALLNDLFGIQARGGCACAGPYAQDLLGIDEEKAKQFEQALLEDSRLDRVHLRRGAEYSQNEVLRPGFVRLNFSYFCSDEEVDFVINAVAMVAEEGWKLLPQYMFNPETGEWRHTKHKIFADRKWLGHVKFGTNGLRVTKMGDKVGESPSLDRVLQIAREVLSSAQTQQFKLPDHRLMFGEDVQQLRWFLLPSEAQLIINKHTLQPPPCDVINIRRSIRELTWTEMERDARVSEATQVEPGRAKLTYKHKVELLSTILNSFHGKNDSSPKALSTWDQSHAGPYNEPPTPALKSSTDDDTLICSTALLPDASATSHSTGANVTSLSTNTSVTSNVRLRERVDDDVDKVDNDVDKGKSSTCGWNCTMRSKKSCVDKVEGAKFVSPPKRLFKLTLEAIEDFQMIQNGDKVLLCLSGGKDSLSLLHVLRQYQFYAKSSGVSFDLGAVTVDPLTSSFDPSPLIPYMRALNVPYFYEEQSILEQASVTSVSSICAFCSRMKRGRIYACARREGWNVLAFAQHLDDLAESFLMSVFHNGLLRTMKANYTVREGDLRVIRPLIYVREIDTRLFAESAKLPVIPENCPACFEAPKERHRMKQLLASQEILHPKLFYSLKEAMQPLYAKNKTGFESKRKQRSIDDEL